MGCGLSKSSRPIASESHGKKSKTDDKLPKLDWNYNPEWTLFMQRTHQSAVENGTTLELRQNFNTEMYRYVKDSLDSRYPECTKAGTTEDLGEELLRLDPDSEAPVATRTFLTLDEGFNGIMYASTVVVNSPMALKSVFDTSNSEFCDSLLESREMQRAQNDLQLIMSQMEEGGTNVQHCMLSIFMGSVMVSARYKSLNILPSFSKISRNAEEYLLESEGATIKNDSGLFMSVLKKLELNYPACTIWDAGEMAFDIDGKPFPHHARMLICRNFEKMNKNVETIDFKVTGLTSNGQEASSMLLRSKDPSQEPGGVVCISLLINLDPSIPWPKCRAEVEYINKAAFTESAKHCIITAFLGGFERCALRIWVAQDSSHDTVIAGNVTGTQDDVQEFSELIFGSSTIPLKLPDNREDGADIESIFGVTLKKQQEHTLWQSESQFQAIRQEMRQKAEANPEKFTEMSIKAGHRSAQHFLKVNFPDTIVSAEGELLQSEPEGDAGRFENTMVFVAKDTAQEPHSICAVTVSVPCPVPGYSFMLNKDKTWIGTPESQRADDLLLALLKQWYSEGKISQVDCFAQVQIGIDATIYQFVDGERFIDYPEERMEQIKWA